MITKGMSLDGRGMAVKVEEEMTQKKRGERGKDEYKGI